jgi:hypothetical protein
MPIGYRGPIVTKRSAAREQALQLKGRMSERAIADQLGVAKSTIHNWFLAAARAASPGNDGMKRTPLIDVDAAYAGRCYGVSPTAVADTHGNRMPPRPDARTYGGVASADLCRGRAGPWLS